MFVYIAQYPVRWTAQSAFHLTPVHSDTNSTSPGSIQRCCNYCAKSIHPHSDLMAVGSALMSYFVCFRLTCADASEAQRATNGQDTEDYKLLKISYTDARMLIDFIDVNTQTCE